MFTEVNRAINIYSVNENDKLFSSHEYYANESQLKLKAFSIIHKINHYTALIPSAHNIVLPITMGNQFGRFPLKSYKFYA
jgi:hypothetical protein